MSALLRQRRTELHCPPSILEQGMREQDGFVRLSGRHCDLRPRPHREAEFRPLRSPDKRPKSSGKTSSKSPSPKASVKLVEHMTARHVSCLHCQPTSSEAVLFKAQRNGGVFFKTSLVTLAHDCRVHQRRDVGHHRALLLQETSGCCGCYCCCGCGCCCCCGCRQVQNHVQSVSLH